MTSYLANVIEKSEAKGRAEGETKGENKILSLISKLYEYNRSDEILKVTTDAAYREKLYKEFNI